MDVVDLDGDGLDEVVLVETSGAVATFLWRDASSPYNGFGSPASASPFGEADTLDTLELDHDLGTRPRVEAFATGDFDLDGDLDLLCAHEGTPELRFWLNPLPLLSNERTRLYCQQEELAATRQSSGESLVALEMQRNPGAEYAHWHVEVWLDPSHREVSDEPVRIENLVLADEDPLVELSFEYDPAAPGLSSDHVCWIVFTGIDYDEPSDEILKRYTSRVIYYSPDSGVEAELESAYYPTIEHLMEDGGESTGLRMGTRAGAGGSSAPPPPQ
jgi:hypothetical protein